MRVLVVEDDVKLAGLIQRALREHAALADTEPGEQQGGGAQRAVVGVRGPAGAHEATG